MIRFYCELRSNEVKDIEILEHRQKRRRISKSRRKFFFPLSNDSPFGGIGGDDVIRMFRRAPQHRVL